MRAQKSSSAGRYAAMVLAATAMAAAIAGCGREKPARTEAAETVRGLHIETVRMQTIPDVLEAPGTVISVATAEIAARTAGTVLRVDVREGDRVQQGQLLAQLDEQELLARRNAAQAGMQQATAGVEEATRGLTMAQAQADVMKKTYDRYVYLRDQKSVSPQEFDEVEAKNRAAQAGLDQAKARLQQAEAGKAEAESEVRAAAEVAGYARIRAPFDGRVVRRLIEPGTVVMPGMQLFVVEKTGEFQLEVTLPAEMLAAGPSGQTLRRGTTAEVRLDALPGKTFVGKVAEIEGGADPATHTVQARVDLARDAEIQSGMFGRASFKRGERQAIAVPESAIIKRGQLRELYVVDTEGIARLRLVTLGRQIGDLREVLSGLGAGEKIVNDPGARALDGRKVEASL